jgi:alkylated DNA repair dioxygenase AlkB
LLINNVLSQSQVDEYVREAVLVERESGLSGHGMMKPRREICYTTNGRAFAYAGVAHRTVAYPPHVLKVASLFVEKVDDLLRRHRHERCEFTELSSGIDIVYDDEFAKGGSVSPHKDDEDPLWGMVMIFSLGQTRFLRIRSETTKHFTNVQMKHNSLVVMYGASFQRDYTHQVDKLSGDEPIGTRLSLNMRFRPGPPLPISPDKSIMN